MTNATSPGVTEREQAPGSRARPRPNERSTRCEHTKAEDGRPCRRVAGADTDHYGEGPCSLHDDGTWTGLTFATDDEAQAAFLDAVREARVAGELPGIRALIEPLGYRRSHVTRLLERDEDFEQAYIEARGYDLDTIRNELVKHRQAGSVPVLLFEAKMRLPEAAVLRQSHTRLDGQIDVRPLYADYSSLRLDGVSEDFRQQILEALEESDFAVMQVALARVNPPAESVPREGRPALELLEGGTT